MFASVAMPKDIKGINTDQLKAIKEKCDRDTSVRYQDKLHQALSRLFISDQPEQQCLKLEATRAIQSDIDQRYSRNLWSDQAYRQSIDRQFSDAGPSEALFQRSYGLRIETNYATTRGSKKTESDSTVEKLDGYTNRSQNLPK